MRETGMIKPIPFSVIDNLPPVDEEGAGRLLRWELDNCRKKVVVLDDDPTGVQTVHGVSVYTDWEPETFLDGFKEDSRMFFILTNSRGMTVPQTEAAHKKMARGIMAASKECQKDFILISRSDSTLRGHYPLETAVLRQEMEAGGQPAFDGEIIYPFFKEGGRYTLNKVHYVKEGDQLVPAGMTEFAKDKSFGYQASDMTEWCEEKTEGQYPADGVVWISITDLRSQNVEKITKQLMNVKDFGKVVVDSADYADVRIFAAACLRAMKAGKHFLFRSAAAVTKVLGDVDDQPLLTKKDLVVPGNTNGGIILIGSHVNKTTLQMEELRNCKYPVHFIEFNQHLVLQEGGLEGEVQRVIREAEARITAGQTVAVYTRRERFDLDTDDKDEQLEVSVRISDAVTSIIGLLKVRPNFIIAKGGITSSDVGTKALRVHRAVVMGQIKPGIPVWMTKDESKFPGMPYVIFPGNVGEISTLRDTVEILMED